ncbi:putative bifunctional diguanylate cyclase/phosphodiesterase [Aureimonas sp. AU40]|uniref:putative bifunctional diguanylate cyclase/phosphodiesterase n=1 Tax=Aureimonas sp. AU40 TaxID=1637747 RepID=UPI00078174C6|nr:EAL domain-containing protein [Aureimonas sp. AU40]
MNRDFSKARSIEQARYHALAKVWPALYLALVGDMIAVSFVHMAMAPWWATFLFPAILIPKALICSVRWYRNRDTIPPVDECVRAVRVLGIEVVVWMGLIVAWEIWLAQWGNADTLIVLMLCVAGQMVFLQFGLLQLRLASLVSGAICLAGLIYLGSGIESLVGTIGVVTVLVMGFGSFALIAYGYYFDFTSLVVSRLTLETKAEEVQLLSETNFRLANTDSLTDIGNRRRCFHDLEKALQAAADTGRAVAFGVLDLDGFKAVNDSNGHVVGDRLLHAMAARIRDTLGEFGDVYRLGGDEFAFIIAGEESPERLLEIGEDLISSVQTPIRIGDFNMLLGCSIGFATYPKSAESAEELYDRADYALFHAKRTGRSRPVVFNEEHERSVRQTALIERTLRAADLEEELYLTFQPIVDSHQNKTMLLECLARWQSPILGLVSPAQFIVAAEQSGFISTLTPILLRKALLAIRQWSGEVGISFNLSGHDIVAPEKVLNLIGILMHSGVAPNRVEFEVTETAIMMNLDQALANLHLLKATGARISLDDFGTGYSSLSQIQKLPLDKIKVDASFVRDLETNPASRKIVSSVTALSRDLSLSCVVEGVETREQLDILQGLGCSLIQGYFYSRPMREVDVEAFLDQQLELRSSIEASASV